MYNYLLSCYKYLQRSTNTISITVYNSEILRSANAPLEDDKVERLYKFVKTTTLLLTTIKDVDIRTTPQSVLRTASSPGKGAEAFDVIPQFDDNS